MKVTLRKAWAVCMMLVLYGALALLPSSAMAAGEGYVFNYNPSAVDSIKQALEDNDHSQDTAINQTTVFGRGGVFGSTPVQFKLDNSVNSRWAANNIYVYRASFTCGEYNIDAVVQVGLPDDIENKNANANIGYTRVSGGNVGIAGLTPPANQLYVKGSDVDRLTANCRPSNYSQVDQTNVVNYQKNKESLVARGWPANLATTSSSAGAPSGAAAGGGGADDNACASNESAGAFAWVLCPAISVITSTVKSIQDEVIVPNLKVAPLDPNDGYGQALYQIWNNIRSVANAAFVLIFLYIIFANTLSFNVNAYTIKKMLPRLVAAAILVQFSFVITALAIDIGNILGTGIAGLVDFSVGGTTAAGSGTSFSEVARSVIVLGASAAAVIAVVGVPTIVIILLGGLIALIGVVFTLIARKLIIAVLVVTSAPAFVAWVLPKTEKFFTTWLTTLIKIILMYPLIVLLFKLSTVLAGVTSSSGNDFEILLAAMFPIIAWFMIPMTFSWGGKTMNMAAGQIGNVTGKTKGAAQGWARNRPSVKAYEQAKADRRQIKQLGKDNGLGSKGPRRWYAQGAMAGAPFAGRLSFKDGFGRKSESAQQRIEQAQQRQWQNVKKSMDGMPKDYLEKQLKNKNSTTATAAAAQLAEGGHLKTTHLKDLKAAHAGNDKRGAKALAFAQSQMKDKVSNPVMARAGWGDIDAATGEIQTLSQEASQSLVQATSPKSLGGLTKEGLQALERADGKVEVIDPTTGAKSIKSGKMIDHIDTKTIENALKSGGISGSMRPEIKARLQAIMDDRTGKSTGPLPDTHSW